MLWIPLLRMDEKLYGYLYMSKHLEMQLILSIIYTVLMVGVLGAHVE